MIASYLNLVLNLTNLWINKKIKNTCLCYINVECYYFNRKQSVTNKVIIRHLNC